MAEDDITDILPKDKGDKFYGFRVSDLQTGGLVVLGLGLAALGLKVFAPDIFKPTENKPQQQEQPTVEQIRRMVEQERLRQQIISEGDVDVTPNTQQPIDYDDMSVESISDRHEKYNTNTPEMDSFDMEYEPTGNDIEIGPNIHKPVRVID